MPVGPYNGPNVADGNGVSTVFAYEFRILDEADLLVTVDGVEKTLTTDYTVSGVDASGGGEVTFTVAPANGTEVVLSRAVPYERATDYQRNGAFDEETVDKDFDSEEMQIQQLAAALMRAFKAPLSVSDDQVLTDAQWAARFGMMLGFDDAGILGVFAALNPADPASAFILTLLDDPDAATAAATLAVIAKAIGTAKGDLIGFTGNAAPVRKAVGANGLFLGADSSQADGLNYLPPSRLTCGRLTLTTALPVTTADVTAAPTVFWTPYKGDTIYIYDGAGFIPFTCAEKSIALDNNAAHAGYHQSGKNFDVFAFNDAGTIRIGTGPTWNSGAVAGSDTARGTGAGSAELQALNGVQTNKNQIDLRWGNAAGNVVTVAANKATYLGSFRTTADGQTEDSGLASPPKRFLWNNYNEVERPMRRVETTASWTYTTQTIRQANGSASNQLEMLIGIQRDAVRISVQAVSTNGTASTRSVGIGLDSTAAYAADQVSGVESNDSGFFTCHAAFYSGLPGLGYHKFTWLETSQAAGTTTWAGNAASAATGNSGAGTACGIIGSMKG